MRKLNKITMLLVLPLVLLSCGPSISVTSMWKAPDIESVSDNKFLVMARTDDMVSRQRFEDEIATQLRAEGIDAVESYKSLPSLRLNVEMSEAETSQQIEKFRNGGFDGMVLTVVKDVKSEMTTSESGGYVTGGGAYGGYGYGGFNNYYGNNYSPYGMGGTYVPRTQRTYTSDIYNLETVVYDLSKSGESQLVAVVSIKITDPASATQVAEPYAKKVIDQFKKSKKK